LIFAREISDFWKVSESLFSSGILIHWCVPQFSLICRWTEDAKKNKKNTVRLMRALCWRMLTYADVCWRMLTYADVCWRMLTYGSIGFYTHHSSSVTFFLLGSHHFYSVPNEHTKKHTEFILFQINTYCVLTFLSPGSGLFLLWCNQIINKWYFAWRSTRGIWSVPFSSYCLFD
jgi:hypothetical protein